MNIENEYHLVLHLLFFNKSGTLGRDEESYAIILFSSFTSSRCHNSGFINREEEKKREETRTGATAPLTSSQFLNC